MALVLRQPLVDGLEDLPPNQILVPVFGFDGRVNANHHVRRHAEGYKSTGGHPFMQITNRDRNDADAGLLGNAEGSLFEGVEAAVFAPGTLGEGDEGVSVLEVFDGILDHLDLGGTRNTPDGNVLGEAHRPPDERDPQNLDFAYVLERAFDEAGEGQDVQEGGVVGHIHDRFSGGREVLGAFHPRHVTDEPHGDMGPPMNDPVDRAHLLPAVREEGEGGREE